ncbi:uncharacterized protein LOC143058494 [Mytilus galloprovincialis]|uniref:uncharacterized protein LOC143058494 n=1 Tax=Mytilus galloprovincialis TaxID=29158 RepID=UPI003F7BDACD
MAVSVLKHNTSSTKAQSVAAANNITPSELNTNDSHGRTVLFYASRYGKLVAVKNLIKAGGDPNISDVDDSSPLHEAVERCHHDIVKILLKHRSIDVNTKNKHGQTPLMKAVIYDDEEMVKLLHKSGADLDVEDSTGKSAFLIGMSEGREKTTEYLMKNGCDINKIDRLGQTALYLGVISPSRASKNSETIRKMLKLGYTLEKDEYWLVKAGVDIDTFTHQNFFQKLASRFMRNTQRRRFSEGGPTERQRSATVVHNDKHEQRFSARSKSFNI